MNPVVNLQAPNNTLSDAVYTYVKARAGNLHTLASLGAKFKRSTSQIQDLVSKEFRLCETAEGIRLANDFEIRQNKSAYGMRPAFRTPEYFEYRNRCYPLDRLGTLADNWTFLLIYEMILPYYDPRSGIVARSSQTNPVPGSSGLAYTCTVVYSNGARVMQMLQFAPNSNNPPRIMHSTVLVGEGST